MDSGKWSPKHAEVDTAALRPVHSAGEAEARAGRSVTLEWRAKTGRLESWRFQQLASHVGHASGRAQGRYRRYPWDEQLIVVARRCGTEFPVGTSVARGVHAEVGVEPRSAPMLGRTRGTLDWV